MAPCAICNDTEVQPPAVALDTFKVLVIAEQRHTELVMIESSAVADDVARPAAIGSGGAESSPRIMTTRATDLVVTRHERPPGGVCVIKSWLRILVMARNTARPLVALEAHPHTVIHRVGDRARPVAITARSPVVTVDTRQPELFRVISVMECRDRQRLVAGLEDIRVQCVESLALEVVGERGLG